MYNSNSNYRKRILTKEERIERLLFKQLRQVNCNLFLERISSKCRVKNSKCRTRLKVEIGDNSASLWEEYMQRIMGIEDSNPLDR